MIAPEYTYIGRNGKPILARKLEDQRDALADIMEEAISAVEWCARRLETNGQSELAESWAKEYRALLSQIKESDQ